MRVDVCVREEQAEVSVQEEQVAVNVPQMISAEEAELVTDLAKKAFENSQNAVETANGVSEMASNAQAVASSAQMTANNANTAAGKAQSTADGHIKDKNNPHGVTAVQVGARPNTWMPSASDVGLGNVPNVSTNDQTPTYIQSSTLTNLVSGEKLSVSMGKIMKVIADLISHIGNKSNPHGVTKSNVGLGNVDNTSDANKPVSTAQSTAIADAKSAGTTAQNNLNSHTGNKSNPHGVTKSQVGLGNVDNVKQYSANNPPPYPVSSVNGKTGVVSLSASDVKARPDTWIPSASDVGARPSSWTPSTSEVAGYKEWFGVGTAIPTNADLNTYTTNGKYYCGNDSTAKTLLNAPTTSNFALYVFDRTGSGTVTQLAITLTGRMYLRGKSSSSWRDWVEFARRSDISKDMMPGTEYTTLERYKGETVYVKLVSQTYTSEIGVAGAPIDYTINHGISNLKEVIRWTGSDGTYTYPYFNANGGIITIKSVDSSKITVRAINAARPATTASPLTLSFILYYIKTA